MNDFLGVFIGFCLGALLSVLLVLPAHNTRASDVVASCQKHGLYATDNTIIKCEAMVLHK